VFEYELEISYSTSKQRFDKCIASLTEKFLVIKKCKTPRKFHLRGIIGVTHEISRDENDISTSLKVCYYPVYETPKSDILKNRENFFLRISQPNASRSDNEEFAEKIRKAILLSSFDVPYSFDQLDATNLPRRKFYVIVNPVSGKRKAIKVYDKVKELFWEADIGHELRKTTHSGHAEEIGRDIDFSHYNAVLTISGDGLIHEFLNGMLSRQDGKKVKLAPVPAGSGNAVATSLAHTYPGPNVLSKVLFAIVKQIKDLERKMSIFETLINDQKRFGTMVCSGIIADTDINSETLRALGGPIRTTVYGSAYILRKKKYSFRLLSKDKDDKIVSDSEQAYLGIEVSTIPFLDEKLMMTPETFGDNGGMYLCEMKHQLSRLQLLDLWDKAENNGSHVGKTPLMLNTKISKIEIAVKDNEKILFTIDGEAHYSSKIVCTELLDHLDIFY